MKHDEGLADRIRTAVRDRDDVVEKKMFGGLTFMVADKMACGVVHDDLMVRVGPDGQRSAVAEPHTMPMDLTGRPMRKPRTAPGLAARRGGRSKRPKHDSVIHGPVSRVKRCLRQGRKILGLQAL